VKVTDELFNNLVINPSVDSIQEFKIQKSQYPAEFGGKASALINVATRAGANGFHGSVFEFLRNDRFDAPNYFDPSDQPIPPLRQNQFGALLGVPLVRDRSTGAVHVRECAPQQRARPLHGQPGSSCREDVDRGADSAD
jgi:hypothetical protein